MSCSALPKIAFEPIVAKPDPVHGTPCTRSSHGVSIIHGGSRLIVYGGEHVARTPLPDDQALWVCELAIDGITPECTSAWKCIQPTGPKPPARVAHAQAAIDDDVYIFGGRAGMTMQEQPMNDVWKLDHGIDPCTWTQLQTTGDSPCERSFHRMVSHGSCLYVFGGCGKEGRLNDLYKLDTKTLAWTSLGKSLLRGRGGPNLLAFEDKLAVIAGFAGEETNDGHTFSLQDNTWQPTLLKEELSAMRPRSVCVAGTICDLGVLFGGEVDPSERGHEGAGGFANDLVFFDSKTNTYMDTVSPSKGWPETRGWSDGAVYKQSNTQGYLYIFGGLSGDDSAPKRLDDLWRLRLTM